MLRLDSRLTLTLLSSFALFGCGNATIADANDAGDSTVIPDAAVADANDPGDSTRPSDAGADRDAVDAGIEASVETCGDQGGTCVPIVPDACANGTWGDPSTCGSGVGVGCCLPRASDGGSADAAEEEAATFDPCSVGPAFAYPEFVPRSGRACGQWVDLAGIGLDCPGVEVRFGDTLAHIWTESTNPPRPSVSPPLQSIRVQVPVLPQEASFEHPIQVKLTVTGRSGLSQTSSVVFTYEGLLEDIGETSPCIEPIDAGADADAGD